ncbi:MAG: slr1658 superfamily regulator [Limnospira sp.]
MTQIFGDFIDAPSTSNEFLVIGFSPSSISLKQRWRNNGLSANFMADYVTTFFPKSEEETEGLSRQSEIKSAVSFIANELLENAMKFSDESSSYSIKIQLFLNHDNLVFFVANSIAFDAVAGFQDYIQELLSSDPEEMYIRQVEKNIENDHQSGLGYLTMVNDYLAQLGWKFEEIPQDSSTLIVTTMVKLKI